ncbi:unnamed protein product [Merluccius merluccius]
MDLFKTLHSFSVGFAAVLLAVASAGQLPKPENLRWLSINFKTLLIWEAKADDHTYSVQYAEPNGNWLTSPNCLHITETECDLSDVLSPNRLEAHGDNGSVALHITDPLTSVYHDQRQLTIREVFKEDLMYKISYQQVGSTRKKEAVRGTNMAVVGDLDTQQKYCFSVAAFIPSRDTRWELGAWSQQQCLQIHSSVIQELSTEALIGGSLTLLVLLIIIIITSVLCCRHHRRQHMSSQQGSQPLRTSFTYCLCSFKISKVCDMEQIAIPCARAVMR